MHYVSYAEGDVLLNDRLEGDNTQTKKKLRGKQYHIGILIQHKPKPVSQLPFILRLRKKKQENKDNHMTMNTVEDEY